MPKILHISDLHVGQTDSDWLWPRMESVLINDLENLFRKTGEWEIVVFSGDLTQKSHPTEYEKLTLILKKLWSNFENWGFNPYLFVVPGNHDLIRPSSIEPCSMALKQWISSSDLQRAVLGKTADTETYKSFITSAFSNYTSWYESLNATKIKLPEIVRGLMPGDISTQIEINGQKIGLIGLNSAWLQLSGDDYLGRLEVHPKQLMEVTNQDPDTWTKNNTWNIIVTHHPSAWLYPESYSNWKSEIFNGERFDCHMFGHMHEPNTTSASESGSATRRAIQAASLFGLERYNNTYERIHGYSVIEFSRLEDQSRFRMWPRRTEKKYSGAIKLGADQKFELIDDSYIQEDYGKKNFVTTLPEEKQVRSIALPAEQISLHSISRSTLHASSFIEAWRLEISQALSSIQSKGWVWISAGVDSGAENFIKSLQECIQTNKNQIFSFDFNGCKTKDELLRTVNEQVGGNFETLLAALEKSDPTILLMDHVEISGQSSDISTIKALTELSKLIVDFCSGITPIIKSRLLPFNHPDVIVLQAFDQADARQYVLSHPKGGRDFDNSGAMAKLFLHSDGIPARLDSAIDTARVFGMSALDASNADITGKLAVAHQAHPDWVIRSVTELSNAGGREAIRPFKLLKALSVFPRGEQYSVIKRFDDNQPFYPADIRHLIQSKLIDAVAFPSVNVQYSLEEGSALVVKRQVRDYLYSTMTAAEIKRLHQRAQVLYFGDNWSANGIKSMREIKFSDKHCSTTRITNANLLVRRAVFDALSSNEKNAIKSAFDLALAYCQAIRLGNHYEGTVSLLAVVVPAADEARYAGNIAELKVAYARALRMCGSFDEAIQILSELEGLEMSKNTKQDRLLEKALSLQAVGSKMDATLAANEALAVEPTNSLGAHAKSIIIKNDTLDADKNSKLTKLEIFARKKKWTVVANNIAYDLAGLEVSAADTLQKISSDSARNGDYYNSVRALIKFLEAKAKQKLNFNSQERSKLIDAYHYLYGENMAGLFDSCHDLLWIAFEQNQDLGNLTSLFRQSSLVWRVRDRPAIEEKYIKFLASKTAVLGIKDVRAADKDTAYFLTRSLTTTLSIAKD